MSRNSQAAGIADFNWDLYADGWNGCSKKENKKIRKSKKNQRDIVHSHERYAQELYNRMSKIVVENVKDAKKGDSLLISDVNIINNDTMSVTVGHGASNVIVDLNKENRLFEQFRVSDNPLTKDEFVQYVRQSPEFKQKLISMNLTTKLGTDTQKGSMWDGYLEKFTQELKEQMILNNKAYYAEILESNPGGFFVNIANTITGFMPGSMASSNKINDYESYVGRTVEVMVESYNPKYGFIVSRKKFIEYMRPLKIRPIIENLEKNPDLVYTGRVTGSTPFGVFVELDEYITGMLHKSLVSDDLRERMRNNDFEHGEMIEVYVSRVEKARVTDPKTNLEKVVDRVILSDVPLAEREEVEIRRKAEDDAEKKEYLAKKAAYAMAQKNAQNAELVQDESAK